MVGQYYLAGFSPANTVAGRNNLAVMDKCRSSNLAECWELDCQFSHLTNLGFGSRPHGHFLVVLAVD